MSEQTDEAQKLSPDELRDLFLFESLDADKLDWLSLMGDVIDIPAGQHVFREGEPSRCFYVLLSGTISLTRLVRGDDVEITRTDYRGSYGGAVSAWAGENREASYRSSMRAVTDCRMWAAPSEQFGSEVRTWFPMATHLLEGLFLGLRNTNEVIGRRERLQALGALAAGLTHELNNPAAAAVRAAESLRDRVSHMRHKLAMLAEQRLDPEILDSLSEVQERAIESSAKAPERSPLEVSDAEEVVGDWLADHDVSGAWDVAPVLVTAGLDVAWLERLAEEVPAHLFDPGLRWITYALETEHLLDEISDATTRMSTLVNAAKQYSQMDRSAQQTFDVHEGLHATTVMLHSKLKGLQVVKDLDKSLPRIAGYPAELNQVWTNLIDNAAGAMAGSGTLTLRTARENDFLLVEIGDTGPGVPEDLRQRIFEPFFTTKSVGEGTGLGLDISFRIVVNRHGGDLRVVSAPGDTRFQVRLPLSGAPAPGEPGDHSPVGEAGSG